MLGGLNLTRISSIERMKVIAGCMPGTVVVVADSIPPSRTITEDDITRAGRTIENLERPYDDLFCDMVRRRIKTDSNRRGKRKARRVNP